MLTEQQTSSWDSWECEVTCRWCEKRLHEDNSDRFGQFGELGTCFDCQDKYACDWCDEIYEGTPKESRYQTHYGGDPFDMCPRCYAEESEEHV